VAALAAVASFACNAGDNASPTGATPVETASGASSLASTTWRLVSIDGREALAGVRVTAIFTDEGRVSGSAGCNLYTGSALVKGEQLSVGLLATTLMACNAEGVMLQEQNYLSALEKAATYRVAGSELRLGPSPGAVILVFKADTSAK
jgi:heat shock protein HslJ